ncbi:MAG: lipoprotein [Bacteroidales bacterium]|nr:lipoprotein [Bacteroidales bacterium]
MKQTIIYLLIVLMVTGCSSSQSKEGGISTEERVNQRIESIGRQGQAVKDMIDSPNTKQSEFIAALGAFYDTLSNVIQHDESFELTRTCRGYARGLSGDLVRNNLPFMANDSVMELIFKMSICGYYWNMPPSANNFVCSTTALTSGNDYDRMADVMLINEEDEEYFDLFSIVIQDNLGDVGNPSVNIVGKDMTLSLDAHRARYVLDSNDNTVMRMSWPLEDVLDALIPGDKVLELSYTAGGQEINMQHILLPLPEAWLRELQKTK